MEKIKIGVVLCFGFVFFPNLTFAQQLTSHPSVIYHANANLDSQKLPPLQWIIEEGEEDLDIEMLRTGQLKDAKQIDLSTNPVFNLKSHRTYWFQLQMSAAENIEDAGLAILHVGDCWPFEFTLHNITAYSFYNNTSTIGKSGLKPASSERDFPKIVNPSLLRINLSKNDTLTMWVKLQKGEGCYMQLDLELRSHENIHAPRQLTTFMSTHILLIGANIALLFLSVLLYYWFREPIYIWFILFQFFILFTNISNHFRNEIFNVFFPSQPFLYSIVAPIFAVIWICSLLQFGRVYINTKEKFTRIHTLLGWAISAFIFVTIVSTYFRIFPSGSIDLWYSLRKLIMGITLIIIFSSLIYLVQSKDKLARFYSFGTFLPFGAILVRLVDLNINDSATARDVSVIISSGVVLTMMLALAYRFRLINQQKDTAMEEKLKAEVENSEQLQEINIAFNKFVPETFINFLGKENILEVNLGDHVEKQVNILFSDIRDYTSLSEKMTPAENFRFVNAFNQRMGPVIQQHHGFINQYLGDGIMAIFPEAPEQTLRAAIAMQRTLTIYNQERIYKKKVPLRMGIGLHTGSLIMGIIGDEKRLDAATISDTVNVVARIESLTKHYGVSILISEEFYKKIENKNAFNFRSLGSAIVKGKEQPVGLYECFDGASTAQIKLKKQTLNHFQKGLQHYFAQEFTEAIVAFDLVLEKNPNDRTSAFFSDKAVHFLANPVESSWTGIEKMDRK